MNRNFAPLRNSASSSKATTSTASMTSGETQYPISRQQHELIQDELKKDQEYLFFFNEIHEDKQRLVSFNKS
jgi:hypothetical protein